MRNRTKTFSVRLSEQEYETLNKAIAKQVLQNQLLYEQLQEDICPNHDHQMTMIKWYLN